MFFSKADIMHRSNKLSIFIHESLRDVFHIYFTVRMVNNLKEYKNF